MENLKAKMQQQNLQEREMRLKIKWITFPTLFI